MKELDDIVKNIQYKLLLNNNLHDEIRTTAYAEEIKSINDSFNTNYEIAELYNLKFENLAALKEFFKTLPLRKK